VYLRAGTNLDQRCVGKATASEEQPTLNPSGRRPLLSVCVSVPRFASGCLCCFFYAMLRVFFSAPWSPSVPRLCLISETQAQTLSDNTLMFLSLQLTSGIELCVCRFLASRLAVCVVSSTQCFEFSSLPHGASSRFM
jgi:hypothetical protein